MAPLVPSSDINGSRQLASTRRHPKASRDEILVCEADHTGRHVFWGMLNRHWNRLQQGDARGATDIRCRDVHNTPRPIANYEHSTRRHPVIVASCSVARHCPSRARNFLPTAARSRQDIEPADQ